MSHATRMKINDLAPEFRKSYGRLPQLDLQKPLSRWLMQFFLRMHTGRNKNPDVALSIEELGDAQARIYIPNGAKSGAGLLWIHGGGMIIGYAAANDADCCRYASELGAVVASVEYRLAPKHPYPAALDDCFAVWLWFLENAERLGVDADRIAISGQSAGGGLSAALCQRILDEGGVQPAAQCLFYPMLDDHTAAREELTAVNHLGWNNSNNNFGWSAYLGQPAGSPETPPWSAPGRREDLSGLPPAWIGVGDKDIFFEEDRAYAARLKQANIPCELVIVDGAPHGFDVVAPDANASKKFISSAEQFLARCLNSQTE